ncbi:MAG: hypothetical protein MZU84_09190 [Sphingobacterium sp.]|nr:hypothetical protein [Sphingobacterium sp.]
MPNRQSGGDPVLPGRCGAFPCPALPAPGGRPRRSWRPRPSASSRPASSFAGRYQVIEELGTGRHGPRLQGLRHRDQARRSPSSSSGPRSRPTTRTIERFQQRAPAGPEDRPPERLPDVRPRARTRATHFITMEYVPGEDLKSFIRRIGAAAAPARPSRIARQVCEGLAEAHRAGRRPPGPQAAEHHDRPGRQRPDHGLRHRPVAQGQGDHRGRRR